MKAERIRELLRKAEVWDAFVYNRPFQGAYTLQEITKGKQELVALAPTLAKEWLRMREALERISQSDVMEPYDSGQMVGAKVVEIAHEALKESE